METNYKGTKVKKERAKESRWMPALALLLVILIAAAVFMKSDIPFIRSACGSLMQRLGYVTEEGTGSLDQDKKDPDKENADKKGADNSDGTEGIAENDPQPTDSGERGSGKASSGKPSEDISDIAAIDENNLPDYAGDHHVVINSNVPEFPEDVYKKAGLEKSGDKLTTPGNLFGTVDSKKLTSYEIYNDLDKLGRTQAAYGCIGRDTMPAEGEERGDISSIHPSGWAKAQNWERCHLIAWSLSAENANPGNLITGTHYLNYDSMRPFEEETSHYIWSTGNHVLYMSEPVYKGDELVARGVHMMARSVEDNGEGLSFNVYCFNVTPGAEIDYKTGIVTTEEQAAQEARLYVINKRSKVFHYPSCDGAKEMSRYNREEVTATRHELTSQGYTPCGACEP